MALNPHPGIAVWCEPPAARPRPHLTVGVTGHREAKLQGVDHAALVAAVAAVLSQVEACVQAVWQQRGASAQAAPPSLRLVSALADGADSLVTCAALEAGWRVDACLPFAREVYADDFSGDGLVQYQELLRRAATVFELPGRRVDPEAAYESVGRLILDQCDMLIALWDGEPNRGRGGTSDVVAEAVARHVPVLHIATHGVRPPELLWSGLGVSQTNPPTTRTVARALVADKLADVVAALT